VGESLDLQRFVGGDFGPFLAWDAVNAPMIRHWCEVMGETSPIYTDGDAARAAGFADIVAPPSMMMAWTMAGYGGRRPPGSGEGSALAVLKVLEESGYPGIVAVNCEQQYERYLEVGDRVYCRSTCESISEEKQTALGAGYLVTELSRFYNQRDELVGTQRFRVLSYRPAEAET
jgi:acyl dehydratase